MTAELVAPFVLEYAYKRSEGPVIGAFLGALRERRILGVRTATGRVLVPPMEYDPDTGAGCSELVEVGSTGRVVTWTRVGDQSWALILLDGADTPLLHRVHGPVATGDRVRARWATDLEGFER